MIRIQILQPKLRRSRASMVWPRRARRRSRSDIAGTTRAVAVPRSLQRRSSTGRPALRDTELDVTSLATIAECRPTVASQHLSKLRFAGLVEGQRQGQRVVYSLRSGHVRALLGEALFHADHQVSGTPVHD
jgi:hypothetical protein